MKRSMCGLLPPIFVFLCCAGQTAIAQDVPITSPIESGFAVITPLDGIGQGLGVSEVFGQEVSGIQFRSSVLPSPLVTSTSVFVSSDPTAAMDTGIAMVNPNAITATVRLTLNNQLGVTVAARTLTVGGRQQISRFIRELFSGTPELLQPFSGLLFINSDFAVGVLGLEFTGPSFTSLPVATQLNATTAVAGGITAATTNVTLVGTQPTQTFNAPVNTAGAIPPVAPIPPVPQTINSPVPITVTQIPSTFPTLPPTEPTNGTTAVVTTTSNTSGIGFLLVRGDIVFAIPQIAPGIGGLAAQLLPQVASGGGWVTTIAIANTSPADQLVRADFFNSQGAPLLLPFGSSLASILVPAGGVVTLSTN